MQFTKKYLILCLLFIMPLQSIAASFQLICQPCQDSYKTSMISKKKISHYDQSKVDVQKQIQIQIQTNIDFKELDHCLSFCAQASMAALTSKVNLEFQQKGEPSYDHYLYHYYSIILPRIQRPPISFS